MKDKEFHIKNRIYTVIITLSSVLLTFNFTLVTVAITTRVPASAYFFYLFVSASSFLLLGVFAQFWVVQRHKMKCDKEGSNAKPYDYDGRINHFSWKAILGAIVFLVLAMVASGHKLS